ncbi:MAG: hypothetical protein BWX95_02575 [Bacteroidetes bacterium ADurb.Bin141]|nr:MAG: hypothetical protein BWX95_02575 [Bacteroidetes bacterium ADurb.Bin141]
MVEPEVKSVKAVPMPVPQVPELPVHIMEEMELRLQQDFSVIREEEEEEPVVQVMVVMHQLRLEVPEVPEVEEPEQMDCFLLPEMGLVLQHFLPVVAVAVQVILQTEKVVTDSVGR